MACENTLRKNPTSQRDNSAIALIAVRSNRARSVSRNTHHCSREFCCELSAMPNSHGAVRESVAAIWCVTISGSYELMTEMRFVSRHARQRFVCVLRAARALGESRGIMFGEPQAGQTFSRDVSRQSE